MGRRFTLMRRGGGLRGLRCRCFFLKSDAWDGLHTQYSTFGYSLWEIRLGADTGKDLLKDLWNFLFIGTAIQPLSRRIGIG